MAENAAEAPAEDVAPKKSKKGLVLVLLLILLPAGSAGATYVMMAGKVKHAAEAATTPSPAEMGAVIPLDSFVVNLNEPGKTRYLKLTIELELGGKLTEDEGKKILPRFRDPVLVYLTGLREADVLGPTAKQTIKKKLVELATKAFGKGNVKAVYYREFVMQ